MLPIRMLDFIDSNIAQTLTSWTYFLHFPITGRVVRAFSGVFYIGSNKSSVEAAGSKDYNGGTYLRP